MSTTPLRRSIAVVVSLTAVLSLAVGCSSNSKSATQKYCDSWQELVTSFKGIQNVAITTGGIQNLDTTVNSITDSAKKLADSADSLAQPRVSALEAALTTLADLVKTPEISSGYLDSVKSAIGDVDTAWNDLVATLKTSCPNVSASTVSS